MMRWVGRTTAFALAAGLFWNTAQARMDFSVEGDFSEEAVRSGVQATRAQCDAAGNAVWSSTPEDGGECLKVWSAGFTDKAERVLVFFHGDIWVGPGKTSQYYLGLTNAKLQKEAEDWARRLKAPYVFIGRPGTHGSSGDHMQRRRVAESRLISAALDRLKEKWGVREFVIAGQSGGGHVTASLLTYRNDITCAVPTSAPSSPRVRWQTRGWKQDATGYADSYEPTAHLDKARMHPALRVFVVGNPQDSNVVWPSQVILATRLKQLGTPVEVIEAEGTGPEGHGLARSARIVGGWCFNGLTTPEMLERAARGLKG